MRLVRAISDWGAQAALLHGSELGTDPPSPERESRHSVGVGYPEQGHRIEDLARRPYLDSLSVEGSTSHTSTDDRLVSVHRVLDQVPDIAQSTLPTLEFFARTRARAGGD